MLLTVFVKNQKHQPYKKGQKMEKINEQVDFVITVDQLNEVFASIIPEQYSHLSVTEVKDFFGLDMFKYDETKKIVVLEGKNGK